MKAGHIRLIILCLISVLLYLQVYYFESYWIVGAIGFIINPILCIINLTINDHIIWAIKYAYYMNKQIKDIRYSLSLAKIAYYDYADWEIDEPKDAVDEELSYWGE